MEDTDKAADFAAEVDLKMAEYAEAKCKLDRALEMKAMNKEEVRERLMMRADMVGQQEELEIIIDELKSSLLPTINLFDKLDEEYQRYIHARRGYYESARNDIESEMEKRQLKTTASLLAKKRSGDYTLSFSLEGDLRLLHSEFTRSAESLLEQMESESEESYRMFGEYLEAHEKLRILDEKMFRNIEQVERDLRMAGDDIQAKINESRAVLEQNNATMLSLIEKQEKMDLEKSKQRAENSEESVYSKTSALDYKEYSAERNQLQSDLESFKRQKEALLKRKSCLLDDLAKIKEKLRMLAAYHRVAEKKRLLEYIHNRSQDIELDDLRLQSEMIDQEIHSRISNQHRHDMSLKKRAAIEDSMYSVTANRRDKSPSQSSQLGYKSPKTYKSFLDCLEKNKETGINLDKPVISRPARQTEPWSSKLLLKHLGGLKRGERREVQAETVSNTSIRSIDDRQSHSTMMRIDPHSLGQFGRFQTKTLDVRSNTSAAGDNLQAERAYVPPRNPSFDQGQLQSFSNTKKLGKRDSSIGAVKVNEEYKNLYFTERKGSANQSLQLSRGATPELDQTSRFSRVQELLGKLNDHFEESKQNNATGKKSQDSPYSPGQALRDNITRFQSHQGGERHVKANKSMHIPTSSADFKEQQSAYSQKENEKTIISQANKSGSKSGRKKDLQSLISQVANMKKQRTKTETDAGKSNRGKISKTDNSLLAGVSVSHCQEESPVRGTDEIRGQRSYLGPTDLVNRYANKQVDQTMDSGNRSYQARMDTSATKSIGSALADIKLTDSFPLFIKRENLSGSKWPTFNPFNSSTVTPEMCGYISCTGKYQHRVLSISSSEGYMSLHLGDITGVHIPQSTIDYARKRHLSIID